MTAWNETRHYTKTKQRLNRRTPSTSRDDKELHNKVPVLKFCYFKIYQFNELMRIPCDKASAHPMRDDILVTSGKTS